jgi:isoleucyl-tRNA synthetase
MFKNLKQLNLPELEEKVLKFWETNDIFNKSVEARRGKKAFVFYEGPPTANGRPAIHHVLGRAFKDIILRYKTMRGYFMPRRAGWDTHGLPVEIEIEKELGIKSKPEIEKFGIAPFNEKAKASVWKYKDEWEKLTARTGLWLDFKNPYITYESNYIESLWWVFSQFDKNKLLKKYYKVVPFCPRCQTTLSSHELAQPGAYKKTSDPSVFVKFKIKSKFSTSSNNNNPEFLLIWTTTPWTLPSNVAVAVNPSLTYTKYKISGSPSTSSGVKIEEFVWSYNPPPNKPGVEIEVVEKISGKKLVGMEYEPLYQQRGSPSTSSGTKDLYSPSKVEGLQKFYRVLGADFVETEQGTGLVHIAPAFGEDDFRLIEKEIGITAGEIPLTIDEAGRVAAGLPGAGKFIKEADKDIITDLKSRGLAYSVGSIDHDYPFCWRCGTPLIYFARASWYVEMSRLRKQLLKENSKVHWIPEHLKEGRFGEWLREVKDWAISRERYWGTPLPIWECEGCPLRRIIGSLAELDKYAFSKNKYFAIRHGEATHNINGTVAAGKETPQNRSVLTEKGIAQIENLAKKLKKEKIDLIFASPFYRIRQTVEILTKHLKAEVIYDKRLEEINAGVFNGRLVQEHKDFFDGNPAKELTKAPPGGESLLEVRRRMFGFIKDINNRYSDKKILIVSHGDPLWVLEAALRHTKDEDLMAFDYIQIGELRELELHNYPYNDKAELDIHRPYVDEVYLRCNKCQSKMKRIKEVADVWFDSGAMPFAQWHYPHENKKLIDRGEQYPSDYIVEGMDQTRGWFYTLLAVAVALGRKTPYKTVMSFGLVLDKNGTKMSKSKGNVVDPWSMFAKYGADVVRWHFYTMNPPGEAKRFDEADLLKVYRRFFAIIYNSYLFLETYGKADSLATSSNVLDQWILSKVKEINLEVTEKLDAYEVTEAGRILESFVDDLSRWYIRRSRRRFQKPEPGDLKAASATLYLVLFNLAKLAAPFAPFFAEGLYGALQDFSEQADKKSVHLLDWTVPSKKEINTNLLAAMAEIRKISSDALALRAKIGIKVRQPLASLKIKNQKSKIKDNGELLNILKEEVNVKEVIFDPSIKKDLELDPTVTPELKAEGLIREFVRLVQDLRQSADYKAGEPADLYAEITGDLLSVFEEKASIIKEEASLRSLNFKRTDKFDAESATSLDGTEIWLAVRK